MDYITDERKVAKINEFLEQELGFLWYSKDMSDRHVLVCVEMHLVGTEPTFLAVGARVPEGMAPSKAVRAMIREVSRPISREELAAFYQEMNERLPQWHKLSASDVMPCRLCNGYYAWANEQIRGIQYEPVPGQGATFLCWECCYALFQKLCAHFGGMAYSFLFRGGRTPQEQEAAVAAEQQAGSRLRLPPRQGHTHRPAGTEQP